MFVVLLSRWLAPRLHGGAAPRAPEEDDKQQQHEQRVEGTQGQELTHQEDNQQRVHNDQDKGSQEEVKVVWRKKEMRRWSREKVMSEESENVPPDARPQSPQKGDEGAVVSDEEQSEATTVASVEAVERKASEASAKEPSEGQLLEVKRSEREKGVSPSTVEKSTEDSKEVGKLEDEEEMSRRPSSSMISTSSLSYDEEIEVAIGDTSDEGGADAATAAAEGLVAAATIRLQKLQLQHSLPSEETDTQTEEEGDEESGAEGTGEEEDWGYERAGTSRLWDMEFMAEIRR